MKAAVIGAGRMGRRHLQVVRGLGLELTGVCDRREAALADAARELELPAAACYTDARRLLDNRPDCVVVATTATSHLEYVLLCAERGIRFVLCEKPMAVSLEQCDRMIRACESSGTRLAVNHQMRFMEQYTLVKQLATSEVLGGLSSATVVAGNFGMSMNGTHYFEMFRYLTEEEPSEVSAWFSPTILTNPRGPEFEDRSGSVRVTTPAGRRLYVEVGADQGHGVRVVYAGPHGRIDVDELTGEVRISARRPEDRGLPTTRYGMPAEESMRKIAPADAVSPSKEVLRALVEGRDVPTGRDGRSAVATLVAAYLSDERGNLPVRVAPGALPLARTFPWA